MRAVVLLADVRESRKLKHRQDLSEGLRSDLEGLNQEHQSSLIAPLEFQKGVDELGGLLEPGGNLGRLLIDLWMVFHPVEARFAVVLGQLDVVPSEKRPSVRHFDGPAMHRASELIEVMKKDDVPLTLEAREGEGLDRRLSLLGSLAYLQVLRWTTRQMELYNAYRETGSQSEVADRFDIAQPSVSEALNKIRFSFMEETLSFLAEEISLLFEEAAR